MNATQLVNAGCLINADIFRREARATSRPRANRRLKPLPPRARINRSICEPQRRKQLTRGNSDTATAPRDDWHMTDLIPKLSNLYNHLLTPHRGSNTCPTAWAELDSKQPLDTYLSSCLLRYHRQMWCSDECFVLALVYVDRLLRRQEGLEVSPFNVRNILFAALVTAAKFYDDIYYSNQYYADVGGMSVEELNRIERLFLNMVDYELHVDLSTFQHYSNMIEVFASPRSNTRH